MYHLNLVFVEERPDLHTPLQQTNSQLQNKKFEFTHNYFPRCFLNEQRKIFVHELIVNESEYFPLDHRLFLKKTVS